MEHSSHDHMIFEGIKVCSLGGTEPTDAKGKMASSPNHPPMPTNPSCLPITPSDRPRVCTDLARVVIVAALTEVAAVVAAVVVVVVVAVVADQPLSRRYLARGG